MHTGDDAALGTLWPGVLGLAVELDTHLGETRMEGMQWGSVEVCHCVETLLSVNH